jgi:hypothetical protein
MLALSLAQPGTAEVPPADSHPSVDPVAWQVDPPLVARLATTAEHVPQVRALLGGGDVARRPPGAPATPRCCSTCR